MKRLNPKTNLPFKYKDVREDGFIFWAYKTVKNLDGFYGERWHSPEKFIRYENETKARASKRNARKRKTECGRSLYLLNGAKRRCREKQIGKVTIDQNWIEQKLNIGLCELTKLPFDFEPPKMGDNTNPYSPSLDRIDNNNPDYTPENTRIVLTGANLALNSNGLKTMQTIFKILDDL